MKHIVIALSLFCSGLFASEQETVQRIYAHLLLEDTPAAVEEARESLAFFPDSKDLQMALIRALAENGDEMEALQQYLHFIEKYENEKNNRYLLEVVSWGILHKAKSSNQLPLNITALLGATLTSDARAVSLLIEQMRDSNAYLRAIAIKLSSYLGDNLLREEIFRLLKEEKVWYVRLEAIQAIGNLHLKKARPYLQEIISNPKTLMEERATAIISLVSMYDRLEKNELEKFIKSNRAGLRQLVCELIVHFDEKSYIPAVVSLTKDSSSDVRMSALNALGLLSLEPSEKEPIWNEVKESLKDPDIKVCMTAAWLGTVFEQKEAIDHLEKCLENPEDSIRRVAAGALAVGGNSAQKLASKWIRQSDDPYVRATLAVGLIGLRKDVNKAADILYELFLQDKQTLWMWDASFNPLFRSLSPSLVKHVEQVPNYPMVVDHLVRLEVLSMLSVIRYPKAQVAVKEFLRKQTWGVTSSAAATLLAEGDEEAMTLVHALLDDKDEKVRIQAALMLALVGGDFSAIHVLEEAYPKVDRDMKIHILEAIAHIKDPSSIPFLLKIMNEPFQTLRVVAASALIQCLNH